jgi:hypothetical protein
MGSRGGGRSRNGRGAEEGKGGPELPTGLADVAQCSRPGYHSQAECVYTGLEEAVLPVIHRGVVSNGQDTSY